MAAKKVKTPSHAAKASPKAGPKAKAPAKAPAKAAGKMAAPAQKKGASTKAAAPAAPANKKANGGAIGSIKKMLGIGAAAPAKKGAPAPAPVKGKAKGKEVAPAPAPVAKGKGKGKEAAPAPAPVKGKKGKDAGAPLTTLSLKKEAKPEPSGPPVCREVACELIATTQHYCRMHYIKNWKKIKRKQMILQERKLNHYIEELVSKYPDKYIEAIRQDLASEKDFAKVIADLEIDEGMDDFESVETEGAEGIIDNLKRDFEDEGDVF